MKYYIAENGQQAGPFEPNELLLHGLTVNSLVWCEGMPNWVSASEVPELMALLSGQPFNPGGMDMQMPQMPPVGGAPTGLPTTPYGPNTTNQPYAQPQYGPSSNPMPQQPMPKNWFTESIIVTIISALCCCNPVALITGIIAIVKANGSKTKYMQGDVAGATTDGSSAKTWLLVTVAVLVIWFLIQLYRVLTDPTLMQQIQEGIGAGSLYGM